MIYAIDKRESRRITILRAFCVVLVIFLHQYAGDLGEATFVASGTLPSNSMLRAVQYIISREITFCAVPLFFMISSVLLYAKEFTWKSNMRKKIKTLILPYFVWISLYILVYWFGQTFAFTQGYFMNAGRIIKDMDIADFFSAYTGMGWGAGLFVNAFWFLRDLIILNFFAIAIKRLIDRVPLLCFVLLTILWNMGTIPNLFILNKQSIVFFSLGYYVVKYGAHMKK